MYTIGQILFVVLSKKNQIYPMQVIEVITKKTLHGEEIKYLLQGGGETPTTIMMDNLEGEVFETAESARSTLINRATVQINRLIDSAVLKSKEWYERPAAPDNSIQTIDDLPELRAEATHNSSKYDDAQTVMLPDGTVAKIKMPSF